MKIAALQMVSGPDVAQNLATAHRLLEDAALAGAKLVALPEYFCLIGSRDDDKLRIAEVPGQGPIQDFLAREAQRLGLWIIGGTLPLKGDSAQHVRNACLVYSPEGQLAARYDKVHLFRFDNGKERYDEGQVLEAGSAAVAVQAASLRVGLSVCYDLRFPEFYRSLMRPPLDLISVPAAFTYTTGRAHWELLLRTRAIENQCYVLATGQGGTHPNGRRTWGHSMVIDPWGEVLACLPEGEGVVLADIKSERLDEVRGQLPALEHRVM